MFAVGSNAMVVCVMEIVLESWIGGPCHAVPYFHTHDTVCRTSIQVLRNMFIMVHYKDLQGL